jgi:hypothetical protein
MLDRCQYFCTRGLPERTVIKSLQDRFELLKSNGELEDGLTDYAAADAVKEAARIRALHDDLGYRTGPTTVHEDNQSCIKQSQNPCDREGQKHIDVRAHYLREQTHAGNVVMEYVSTNLQIADCLSKNLPRPAFELHRKAMGLAVK